VPYAAIIAGGACFAVAYWVERSPHTLLFVGGGALVTVGALLWMRRRDYRTMQSDYDPRAIDE
jgi:hypothetical protein